MSPHRTPKMFSLGIETEESIENFLTIVDVFLPPPQILCFMAGKSKANG